MIQFKHRIFNNPLTLLFVILVMVLTTTNVKAFMIPSSSTLSDNIYGTQFLIKPGDAISPVVRNLPDPADLIITNETETSDPDRQSGQVEAKNLRLESYTSPSKKSADALYNATNNNVTSTYKIVDPEAESAFPLLSDSDHYKFKIDPATSLMSFNDSLASQPIVDILYKGFSIRSSKFDVKLSVMRAVNITSSAQVVSFSKTASKLTTTSRRVMVSVRMSVFKDGTTTPVSTDDKIFTSLTMNPSNVQIQGLTKSFLESNGFLLKDDCSLLRVPRYTVQSTLTPFENIITSGKNANDTSESIYLNFADFTNSVDSEGITYNLFSPKALDVSFRVATEANTVTLKTEDNSESVKESVVPDGQPTKTTELESAYITDGFRFSHWVANKQVTLTTGKNIPAGDHMTKDDVKNIIVTSDLTLTLYRTDKLGIEDSVVGGTLTSNVPDLDDISEGDDVTFTYAPFERYVLKSITIDGSSVSITDNPTSYTFSNVTESHSIHVVFEKKPELNITQSLDKSVVNTHGDEVSVTMNVSQTVTDAVASNTKVVSELPTGFEFVQGSVTGVGSSDVSVNGSKITIDLGNMTESSSTISYKLKSTNTDASREVKTIVSADNTGSKTATNSVRSATPNISVSKTASKTKAVRDDVVRFMITINNNRTSRSELRFVKFEDVIPEGLSYNRDSTVVIDGESSSISGMYSGRKLTADVGSFKNSAVITYDAKVVSPYGTLSNIVDAERFIQQGVSAPERIVSTSCDITVIGPKLSIISKANKEFTYYDDTYTYTTTVSNSEPNTYAEDVYIDELVDDRYTTVDINSIKIKDENGNDLQATVTPDISSAGRAFKVKIDKLTTKAIVTYDVHTLAKSRDIHQIATASSNDTNQNEISSSTSTPVKQPTLSLEKSVLQKVVNPNENLSYSVKLTDNSGVVSTNTVIKDVVPEGLEFASGTPRVEDFNITTNDKYEISVDNNIVTVTIPKFTRQFEMNYIRVVRVEDGRHLISTTTASCDNIEDIITEKTDTFVTIDKEEVTDQKADNDGDSNNTGDNSQSGTSSTSNRKSDRNDKSSGSNERGRVKDGDAQRTNAQTGDYILLIAFIVLGISVMRFSSHRYRRSKTMK